MKCTHCTGLVQFWITGTEKKEEEKKGKGGERQSKENDAIIKNQ
jgi:hypothetical protein